MAVTVIAPADIFVTILRAIAVQYPFIKETVFDPTLDYEHSVSLNRLNNDTPTIERSKLPLLSWNRSPFRKAGTGRYHNFKAYNGKAVQDVNFSVLEADFRFSLFTSTMIDIEKFELDWYLNKGIRTINKVEIEVENEKVSYSIIWGDNLDDVLWNLESNYYKALSGTAMIVGPLIRIDTDESEDAKSGLIESIKFSFMNCYGDEVTLSELKPDPNDPPTNPDKLKLFELWKLRQKDQI